MLRRVLTCFGKKEEWVPLVNEHTWKHPEDYVEIDVYGRFAYGRNETEQAIFEILADELETRIEEDKRKEKLSQERRRAKRKIPIPAVPVRTVADKVPLKRRRLARIVLKPVKVVGTSVHEGYLRLRRK